MARPLNPSSFSNALSFIYSFLSLLQLCNSSFFNSTLWCNSPFFPNIRYTQESVQSNLTPTTQLYDISSSTKTLHLLLFWVAYKVPRSNQALPEPIHYPDSSNLSDSNWHSAQLTFPRVRLIAFGGWKIPIFLCLEFVCFVSVREFIGCIGVLRLWVYMYEVCGWFC